MPELPDVLTIDFALLCDDVRREVTGKDIIIGVYGEEITTPNLPVVLVFNLFMRVRFPKPDTSYLAEFRVIGPSDRLLTQAAKSISQISPKGWRSNINRFLGWYPTPNSIARSYSISVAAIAG